jgi:hypothetical protein
LESPYGSYGLLHFISHSTILQFDRKQLGHACYNINNNNNNLFRNKGIVRDLISIIESFEE